MHEGIIREAHTIYTCVDEKTPKINLDIYRPEKSSPNPAIVMFFGGGWQMAGQVSLQV